MRNYVLYEIKNLVNNRTYIGQTVDFTRRRKSHLRDLQNNTHRNHILQKDFNQYGISNFTINKIGFYDTKEHINIAETFNILNIGFPKTDYCYNLMCNAIDYRKKRKVASKTGVLRVSFINGYFKYEFGGKTVSTAKKLNHLKIKVLSKGYDWITNDAEIIGKNSEYYNKNIQTPKNQTGFENVYFTNRLKLLYQFQKDKKKMQITASDIYSLEKKINKSGYSLIPFDYDSSGNKIDDPYKYTQESFDAYCSGQ